MAVHSSVFYSSFEDLKSFSNDCSLTNVPDYRDEVQISLNEVKDKPALLLGLSKIFLRASMTLVTQIFWGVLSFVQLKVAKTENGQNVAKKDLKQEINEMSNALEAIRGVALVGSKFLGSNLSTVTLNFAKLDHEGKVFKKLTGLEQAKSKLINSVNNFI